MYWFFVYFLVAVVSLVVNTSAVDCLERLVSKWCVAVEWDIYSLLVLTHMAYMDSDEPMGWRDLSASVS